MLNYLKRSSNNSALVCMKCNLPEKPHFWLWRYTWIYYYWYCNSAITEGKESVLCSAYILLSYLSRWGLPCAKFTRWRPLRRLPSPRPEEGAARGERERGKRGRVDQVPDGREPRMRAIGFKRNKQCPQRRTITLYILYWYIDHLQYTI